MAKKRRKAARRGDASKLRMTRALARHGLTMAQAGRLSDADLRRHKGIGRALIAVIRTARGPAPSPTRAATVDAQRRAARDERIATLERHVAELLEAVRHIHDLLRVRGLDGRDHPSSGPETDRQAQILRKTITPNECR